MIHTCLQYSMITVTLFGRGGQGIKSTAHVMSTAAFLDGNYVQDQPLYSAERRGAPISAYIRISKHPILARGYVWQPLFLIVADDSLLDHESEDVLQDVTKDTVILVNSALSTEQIASKYSILNKISVADLSQLAMDVLHRHMVSVAVAGAAARLIGLDIQNLKQAVALELKEIGIRDEEVVRNMQLAKDAYDATPYVEAQAPSRVQERAYGIIELQYHGPKLSTCTITGAGNASARRTGDWSLYKPQIDYEKCTKCTICFVYYPDSGIAIDKASFPVVDYNACKGCDLCTTECPPQAITLVKKSKK